ncbi:hypothetical protein J7382_11695 [Shimia sp. R11_0]|uniref:hypothetical protein n=1 Tax=Shimia sp. R11_0 TaxID=2821096 RepID=UPI001ADA9050|nr:hypothetical protein [Shimia sp. R11_0]MBO9478199.1 hypothetical protein [Shimia sp. R11_0]
MALEARSFEVYGFTIEIHAGGRRVWPPSFKRFINDKMDRGELSVGEVMKTCNVSQSLVYKWRGDVRRGGRVKAKIKEERMFSEVIVQEDPSVPDSLSEIVLRGKQLEITLPASYPVSDLVSVIHALS